MNLTTDKLRSMVKKWQTLIEAHVDAKTTDGYLLRVFCIGFTQKQSGSTKKHCYAQSQQVSNQSMSFALDLGHDFKRDEIDPQMFITLLILFLDSPNPQEDDRHHFTRDFIS